MVVLLLAVPITIHQAVPSSANTAEEMDVAAVAKAKVISLTTTAHTMIHVRIVMEVGNVLIVMVVADRGNYTKV